MQYKFSVAHFFVFFDLKKCFNLLLKKRF